MQSHRRRSLSLASTFAVGLLCACWTHASAAGAPDSLAEHGKYVAIEADCMSCHTAPGGKPYAGGYPLKSPLGIIYGPNITPDPETGIGRWSKADFDKALRLGVNKAGDYLYPAMPYQNYTKMSTADMDALWAYMHSLTPVKNTPPKNTLPFPFTVRSGIAVWQSLYFKPGAFEPDSTKDADWNRGAYLVQTMGHCDQCHTPRNVAQGLQTHHNLGGAQIQGWYAPDISSDQNSALRRWNTAELAHYLKTGTTPANEKAVGPMAEAVHDSLRLMTDTDLHAIAVFLKDQPHIQPEVASRVTWGGERLTLGKAVYDANCSTCHESNGKGVAGSVPSLVDDGAVTAQEPYNVVMAMLEGFSPQGTWGAMGSFATVLTDEQIADVSNYVRTAWGNQAAANATPWGVETLRKTASVANNQTHALLCPTLASDVVQPALREGPAALKEAAADRSKLTKIIGDYRSARPHTSSAQVVEALSTAYCRAVAADHISEARMSAQISDFAQRVAVTLAQPPEKPMPRS